MRAFVVERIERLRAEGGGDVVADLFKPMPSFVVAYYLGVPEADWPRFDGWTEGIVAANAEGDALPGRGHRRRAVRVLQRPDRAEAGRAGRRHHLRPRAHGRRRRVDLMQILGFAFTMVTGGNDTTTGMLGTGAELLTRYPDQRARLLADPESLLDGAIEELLRLSAPVQGLARTTTRPVELHGRRDPRGQEGAAAVWVGQP